MGKSCSEKSVSNFPQIKEKKFQLLVAGVIFGLALIVYLPGIKNGFIYDDKFLILRNPLITGEKSWRQIFLTEFYQMPGAKSFYYRPLVNLSYRLNYYFGQTEPFGYHLVNIILHSLVSVLVFLAVWSGTKNFPLASIAGLLFALHPAHTQSVSWISGRTDLLFSFFGLLVFTFYFRAEAQRQKLQLIFYFLSWVFFLLSLFCKETALVVPVLIGLWDWARLQDFKMVFRFRRILIYAGFVGSALIYFGLRFKVVGFSFGEKSPVLFEWYYQGFSDVSRLATVFKVYFYYLQTLLAPIHLSFESKMLVSSSWLEARLVGSVITVLFVLGIGFYRFKKNPILGLGIFWFFSSLVPVANIIPFRELVMEHLLYFPSIGFCLGLAFIFAQVLGSGGGRGKKLVYAILVLLLLSYGSLTVFRQGVWRNELVFWRDAVIKAPLKRRPWYNYGIRVKEKGDVRSALRAWKLAVRAEPNDAEVHNNLGALYFEIGELDLAIQEFQEALRCNPHHLRARINLENVLKLKSQTESRAP